MTKQELRIKYKALRQAMPLEEVEEKSLAIANKLLQLPVWDKLYYQLFLTMEQQKEPHTDFILQILSGKDKEVVVSRSDFQTGNMVHYLLTDNTRILKSKHGIPEPVDGIEVPPAKIDVVFVPLLAYDTRGHRVGYGKGFYDRFLMQCKPEAIKIGLSFFGPQQEPIETNATDVALDFCATPDKIYSF